MKKIFFGIFIAILVLNIVFSEDVISMLFRKCCDKEGFKCAKACQVNFLSFNNLIKIYLIFKKFLVSATKNWFFWYISFTAFFSI